MVIREAISINQIAAVLNLKLLSQGPRDLLKGNIASTCIALALKCNEHSVCSNVLCSEIYVCCGFSRRCNAISLRITIFPREQPKSITSEHAHFFHCTPMTVSRATASEAAFARYGC